MNAFVCSVMIKFNWPLFIKVSVTNWTKHIYKIKTSNIRGHKYILDELFLTFWCTLKCTAEGHERNPCTTYVSSYLERGFQKKEVAVELISGTFANLLD